MVEVSSRGDKAHPLTWLSFQ